MHLQYVEKFINKFYQIIPFLELMGNLVPIWSQNFFYKLIFMYFQDNIISPSV